VRPSRRSPAALALAAALAACAVTAACALTAREAEAAGARSGDARAPTREAFRASQRRVAALRGAAQAKAPRTLDIGVTVREPTTGHTLRGRGAIALRGPDALRMILVGPGGATALDLWSRGDAFRFAVPAMDLVKRGRVSREADHRGLPVAFLRWWLVDPMRGRLLFHAQHADGEERFVLRDGGAVVDLRRSRDGSLRARRSVVTRAPGRAPRVEVETVAARGFGCHAARYVQHTTGLVVDVTCEREGTRVPPSRAFDDPDPGEPLVAPGQGRP